MNVGDIAGSSGDASQRGAMLVLTFLWFLAALLVGLFVVYGLRQSGTGDRRRRLRESVRAMRKRCRQT